MSYDFHEMMGLTQILVSLITVRDKTGADELTTTIVNIQRALDVQVGAVIAERMPTTPQGH